MHLDERRQELDLAATVGVSVKSLKEAQTEDLQSGRSLSMPFSAETKARMFVRSARICPLCFKQCGTRVEAAHIVAESAGGSNEDDNGIPLCFDCHADIGAYNPLHPKGNKFSPSELKSRRNQLYDLVEKGTLQAQIVAEQLRSSPPSRADLASAADLAASRPYKPSQEARTVLEQARMQWGSIEALPGKLRLLEARDRAYIQDQLLDDLNNENALGALLVLASSHDTDASRVLLEQLTRRVTLTGSIASKSSLLMHVQLDRFVNVDDSIRATFYRDIVDIMDRDQFEEVNQITPAVVRTHEAIPASLLDTYMRALLDQAQSNAWTASPAAIAALRDLPEGFVRAGLAQLTPADFLARPSKPSAQAIREFVERNRTMWPQDRTRLLGDVIDLRYGDFITKYGG